MYGVRCVSGLRVGVDGVVFAFILDLSQVFCWFVVILFCGAAECFWHFELFWCLFGISGFW